MILWYSGCGNSRFVADTLSKELGDDNMIFIPEAARQAAALEFGPDEALGIVFPVYSWSVPKLVSEFLRTVSIKGKPSYIFAACTCGDQTGLTYEHLCKDLRKQGLQLDAFFSFQMPETYINLPGFSLDTCQMSTEKLEGIHVDLRLFWKFYICKRCKFKRNDLRNDQDSGKSSCESGVPSKFYKISKSESSCHDQYKCVEYEVNTKHYRKIVVCIN